MQQKTLPVLGHLLLVFILLSSAIFGAQLDDAFAPVISGSYGTVTHAAQRSDGKIVVAGRFRVIGGKRRNLIAVLNSDGTVDSSFDIGKGISRELSDFLSLDAIAVQSDHKIIIGGSFNRLNGLPQNFLARLNPDGTVDTSFNIGQGADGQVRAIKIQPDGKILLTGGFFNFNSQEVGRIVRLNPDGTRDTSYTGVMISASLPDLTVQTDGKIIVVGGTMIVNGTQRRGVARLNADGTMDSSFNPGTGTSSVNTVAIQPDGKILIGGGFATFNGSDSVRGIVRLNPDGTVDNSFVTVINPNGVTQSVYSLSLLADGKIIIGGNFGNVNGISRERIARLNSDGTLDPTFTPTTNHDGNVSETYILSDQRILIGGSFSIVNNVERVGTAILNSDGTLVADFAPDPGGVGLVLAIAVQGNGQTIIGGSFTNINGQPRRGIARLNADGSSDMTFNSGSGTIGEVSAVAVQPDGKILVGGGLTSYNGVVHANLMRLNPDGTREPNFPQGITLNNYVHDIIIQNDNKILVSGSFARGIARLTPGGAPDAGFVVGTGISGAIRSMKVQPDGKIIIAGGFSNYNGTPRSGIARLNADGTLDNTFNAGTGPNSTIYDTALQPDGKIIAVGEFTTFNGNPFNRIVRLNSDGSIDQAFNAGTGATDFQILAVQLQSDGKIILGGIFNSFNGTSQKKVVRLLPNGSLDASLNFEWLNENDQLEQGASVFSLALNNNNLFVGGAFTEINGTRLASFAKISLIEKAPYDFDGDGKTDIGIFRPSDGSWWYSRSSDNAFRVFSFGASGDMITPGDFTGDGKADIAVFRPSSGEWFIQRSENNSFFSFPFGAAGDVPVPADYDGDGKTDAAVYRPASGTWFILNSNGSGTSIVNFGSAEDKPVPADFDGDGKADIAIFRPSDGSWWYLRSSDAQFRVFRFGLGTDKPVPGDFTGDGKADLAVFRPSTGEWFFQRSEDGSYYSVPFGANGDIATPGDYDGDGKLDTAVFRPSTANWFVQRSTAGILITSFGAAGDRPIPNAFVP